METGTFYKGVERTVLVQALIPLRSAHSSETGHSALNVNVMVAETGSEETLSNMRGGVSCSVMLKGELEPPDHERNGLFWLLIVGILLGNGN